MLVHFVAEVFSVEEIDDDEEDNITAAIINNKFIYY